MLDSQILDGSNIVTATYSGSLGADETANLRRQVETVIASEGSARLLLEVGDLDAGRVEPKAVWEDLKSARLLDDITRMALVGDDTLMSGLAQAMGTLSSTETKTFAADDRDQAVVWLQS